MRIKITMLNFIIFIFVISCVPAEHALTPTLAMSPSPSPLPTKTFTLTPSPSLTPTSTLFPSQTPFPTISPTPCMFPDLVNTPYPRMEPYPEISNEFLSVTENQSLEEIAVILFSNYLDKFILSSPPTTFSSLESYKILEADKILDDFDDFDFVNVYYSVKPIDVCVTSWLADDGTRIQKTGWIENKSTCLIFQIIDGQHTILKLASYC